MFLSHLIRTDSIDLSLKGLKALSGILESGVNQAIDYIEKVSGDGTIAVDASLGQVGTKKHWRALVYVSQSRS